jgi:hypothetical protein
VAYGTVDVAIALSFYLSVDFFFPSPRGVRGAIGQCELEGCTKRIKAIRATARLTSECRAETCHDERRRRRHGAWIGKPTPLAVDRIAQPHVEAPMHLASTIASRAFVRG